MCQLETKLLFINKTSTPNQFSKKKNDQLREVFESTCMYQFIGVYMMHN